MFNQLMSALRLSHRPLTLSVREDKPIELSMGLTRGFVHIQTKMSDLSQQFWQTAISGYLFSQYSGARASPVVDQDDPIRRAKSAFLLHSASLPESLRIAVRAEFSQLLSAVQEEPGDFVVINAESIKVALRFLNSGNSILAPQFSLTETGDFYLQWFDGSDKIVGVTFKANGRAVWSASQGDPSDSVMRMAEAGERHAEKLTDFLNELAPWMFNERTTGRSRRRAAA